MGRLGRLTLGTALALVAAAGIAAPAAQGRDAIVNSFDGTPIVTHYFPAPGASASNPAPTIMIGHGWGGSGATSPPAAYANAGFNVLTWDARGFGGSGGTVMIDHPDFEARDAMALIDFIADQPESLLDASNDPRVGMDGPSYGGGIQLITASQDPRVDAITPTIAWNSLTTSLYKANAVKLGWSTALVALGIPTSLLPGVFSPAGVQTGNQSPQFFSLVTNGVATGRFTAPDAQWLAEHGPDHLLSGLRAPTMIVQGTVDTLFTLDEAHRNFTQLKAQGTPVKMMWFCGGHGACLTGTDAGDPLAGITGDGGLVGERKLAWFNRYLKEDQRADTGPAFEWIDEEGAWHRSGGYPQTRTGTASAEGSGNLVLTPGANPSGVVVFASPAVANSVDIPVSPPAGSQVLGAPKLDLTYTATGASLAADGKTHVYAQLVDTQRNLVVNNLATPIPIELDGQEHEVTVELERIASLATGAGYELQLIPQTTLYDAQRATGTVNVTSARIDVPITEPVPITAGQAIPVSGKPIAKNCTKAKKKGKKRKKGAKRAEASAKKKKKKRGACKKRKKKKKKKRK